MTDILSRLKAALSDRYVIERELGRGGMAVVYLAHDIKHERKVAIKVLRPELAAALGAERFHREIKIAANLHHPHILPLYDSGDADGFLYYVMPYEEGQSLREKLAKEGELPIPEAVRILRDIVEALKHAHKNNVVHRDIKPDNVMLAEDHALVTDFGVAKAVSDATGAIGLTTEGVALGTPAYMAPEQAAADPHIDHRADIYAVGAVAYELLTGRPPFTGTTPQEILASHVTKAVEPVTEHRDAVSPALAELVMRCLEKKPADRWQTAEELLPQLESSATPSGGTTLVGTEAAGAAARTRKIAIAASAAAVVLTVVLVAMLLPRGSSVELNPERIVVSVFRNETGEPQLEAIGRQAANWITQGLQRVEGVNVTSWETARQASLYVQREADAGRVHNTVRALAEETGAGVVISGTYYTDGADLQFHAEVVDAIGDTLLGAVSPAVGRPESHGELIEQVQQRVMSFLAIRLDDRFAMSADLIREPTSLEAYQAFDQGMETYLRHDYIDAVPYFERALELDSAFVLPLRFLAISLRNSGQDSRFASVVNRMEGLRDHLTQYQVAWLEQLDGLASENLDQAMGAARRAAAMAPGSKAVYNQSFLAEHTNRPQEAVAALETLNPERGSMRGWSSYWRVMCNSLHMLGEYERELEEARRGHQLFPVDAARMLRHQARALAAMGRIEELQTVLNETANATPVSSVRDVMVQTVEILRAHGYSDASSEVLNRAIDWLSSRPRVESSEIGHRQWYGRALALAGRLEEALDVFSAVVEESPESGRLRGLRGFVAAMQGDAALARSDAAWLEGQAGVQGRGQRLYWRGAIAGALGDHEEGLSLLREAFAEGYFYWWWMPSTMELAPLRDHPEFQELMRPKG